MYICYCYCSYQWFLLFCYTLFSKKCKERKQNDRGALYENTEMKTSSDNKYVTLTTDQPPVPLYETPHTLTDEIKLKFNKKDKHPYANEKPKKQKKPDTKVKSYANINFRKGKNSDCFIRVVDILSLFQIFYYRYLNFIAGAWIREKFTFSLYWFHNIQCTWREYHNLFLNLKSESYPFG